MTPEPDTTLLSFRFGTVNVTCEVSPQARDALLVMLPVRANPEVWNVLELTCRYHRESAEEKANIVRTITELLEGVKP